MRLPSFKEMDLRIAQEMARCAKGFDETRAELADHHKKLTAEHANLEAKKKALEPHVDRVIESGKLDKSGAGKCLDYLDTTAKLHKTLVAKRICYPSTIPVGRMTNGDSIK